MQQCWRQKRRHTNTNRTVSTHKRKQCTDTDLGGGGRGSGPCRFSEELENDELKCKLHKIQWDCKQFDKLKTTFIINNKFIYMNVHIYILMYWRWLVPPAYSILNVHFNYIVSLTFCCISCYCLALSLNLNQTLISVKLNNCLIKCFMHKSMPASLHCSPHFRPWIHFGCVCI